MKPDPVEKRGGVFHLSPTPQQIALEGAKRAHPADLAALQQPLESEELQAILLRALTRLAALEEEE